MNTCDVVVAVVAGALIVAWLIYDFIRNIKYKKQKKNENK